jgi:hypothetical protein
MAFTQAAAVLIIGVAAAGAAGLSGGWAEMLHQPAVDTGQRPSAWGRWRC